MEARATSLALISAAAHGAPFRLLAHRHFTWELKRFVSVAAFPLLAIHRSGGGGPHAVIPRIAIALFLSAAAVVVTLPCQPCRHEERMSFALGLTDTDMHFTQVDRLSYICCGAPPPQRVTSARLADVLEVREGCFCCCWSVHVLLRDPATGGRKKTTVCCMECNKGPDFTFDCTEQPAETVQAVKQLSMDAVQQQYSAPVFVHGAATTAAAPQAQYSLNQALIGAAKL